MKRTVLLLLVAVTVAASGFAQLTIGAGYQRHDYTLSEESFGSTFVTEIDYDLVSLVASARLTGGNILGVHVTASSAMPLNVSYRFSEYQSDSLVSTKTTDYALGDLLFPPIVLDAGLSAGLDTGDDGTLAAFVGVGPFAGYRVMLPSDLEGRSLPLYLPLGVQATGRVGVWLSEGFGLAVVGRWQWGLADVGLWLVDHPPIHDSWFWSVGLAGMTR